MIQWWRRDQHFWILNKKYSTLADDKKLSTHSTTSEIAVNVNEWRIVQNMVSCTPSDVWICVTLITMNTISLEHFYTDILLIQWYANTTRASPSYATAMALGYVAHDVTHSPARLARCLTFIGVLRVLARCV